jgi:hypothetical protein
MFGSGDDGAGAGAVGSSGHFGFHIYGRTVGSRPRDAAAAANYLVRSLAYPVERKCAQA